MKRPMPGGMPGYQESAHTAKVEGPEAGKIGGEPVKP